MKPQSIKILSNLSGQKIINSYNFNTDRPWQTATIDLELNVYQENNVMLSDISHQTYPLSGSIMDQAFEIK